MRFPGFLNDKCNDSSRSPVRCCLPAASLSIQEQLVTGAQSKMIGHHNPKVLFNHCSNQVCAELLRITVKVEMSSDFRILCVGLKPGISTFCTRENIPVLVRWYLLRNFQVLVDYESTYCSALETEEFDPGRHSPPSAAAVLQHGAMAALPWTNCCVPRRHQIRLGDPYGIRRR